jgi:uncharacterized membrane protein
MEEQNSSTNAPNPTPIAPMPHAQNRTAMGVLSYLGILVVVPIIMAKDDPFVKFHIKQGLVLLIIDIIVWVLLGGFLWRLYFVAPIINLGILILIIMGIINVVNGKEQELPLVGSLAKNIPL